jgi:hypothetical protein
MKKQVEEGRTKKKKKKKTQYTIFKLIFIIDGVICWNKYCTKDTNIYKIFSVQVSGSTPAHLATR